MFPMFLTPVSQNPCYNFRWHILRAPITWLQIKGVFATAFLPEKKKRKKKEKKRREYSDYCGLGKIYFLYSIFQSTRASQQCVTGTTSAQRTADPSSK